MSLSIGDDAGEPWLWQEVFAVPMSGKGSPRDALCLPPWRAVIAV